MIVIVDDDDPKLDEYQSITDINLIVGPRRRLGPTLNHFGPEYAKTSRNIGFMGDDHVPRTEGWDVSMTEALDALRVGVVYGNDLYQRESLPTAVAMTSNIVSTLGYMVQPGAIHLFLDNFWLALGRELRRITYLPDVIIEHMHPYFGRATMDDGYAEANSPQTWQHDEWTYNEWVRERMNSDIAALRALL